MTTNAVLTQNLFCTGDGVIVGVSGITIDLKGFRPKGDGDAGDYGIAGTSGFDGVTIKNGTLRNFEYGVRATPGVDKISVSNVVASGKSRLGIFVEGDLATIQCASASGNLGTGIWVNGDSASIKSVTTSGNGGSGVFVDGDFTKIQSVNASRPTIQVTRFVARGVRASSYARPVREPFNAGYR